MKRSKVVVGRKWNNPQIYTHVDSEKIEMQISVEDFLTALVEEMGSPAMVMTRAALRARLAAAAKQVLEEVKRVSREVV